LHFSEPEIQKSFKNRALRAPENILQEENRQNSPLEQKVQTPPKFTIELIV
jgi:hypothetical protein